MFKNSIKLQFSKMLILPVGQFYNNIFYYFILVLFVVLPAIGQVGPVHAGESLLRIAESGDAEAQFEFGRQYGNDASSVEDFQKAYFWIRKAAEQGMAKAQFLIADMYCSGSGVTQSYIDAYAWHYLAAKSGFSAAEEKIEILEQLFLTPDDIEEALKIADGIEGQMNSRE